MLPVKRLYLHQNLDFGIQEAYLWSTNDGKASWSVGGCQKQWQSTCMKLESSKNVNRSYSSSFCKAFVPPSLSPDGRRCAMNREFQITVYGER